VILAVAYDEISKLCRVHKRSKSLQADREFKNITLYKSDSVKVSYVGYLFDIKIVYLCKMA